jgi:hypothetical protein
MPDRKPSPDKPDYRLQVYIWGVHSSEDPQIEHFPARSHQTAILWALDVANNRKDISRVQVIDAWGMLIAQFCARWIYVGKAGF